MVVKPSNNPFFQTTQSDIGYNPSTANRNWKSPLTQEDFDRTEKMMNSSGRGVGLDATAEEVQKASYDKGNFAFLYTRTSDTIGSKVPKASKNAGDEGEVNGKIPRPHPKSKAEFLRDCFKSTATLAAMEQMIMNNNKTPEEMEAKQTPEEILRSYKHQPKSEDARYTTTNNEIGKRAPTVATFVSERHGIPQDFSNGFNNVKPQNTSLNTGITKSNIHPKLDPQFA